MVTKVKESNVQKLEERKYGICPKCRQVKIVKRKGQAGIFYPCNQQACGYSISHFYKFNDSDIERLLSGKYSSTINLKNKEGKQYKAKFILENGVLKRGFLNKKK